MTAGPTGRRPGTRSPHQSRGQGQWWWRLFVPRRTIRPTRDGWWALFAAVGLGVAAVNTGNNLAYLLCSMLLAVITVSGILSDQSMRGLHLTPVLPEEIYAGRPALFGAVVANRKRRLVSYSIAVEVLAPASGRPRDTSRTLCLPRLEAGAERVLTWEATLPARGRRRLPGLRLTTRFPFGLFVKTGRVVLDSEVLVYPAVHPVSPDRLRQLGGVGDAATRRRGRGHDLYNLRQYRPGDDPRLIHWPSSAKAHHLTVREMEEDTALDARLVLVGVGGGTAARLERGLSEAASLAVHLLRTGAGVEVVGPGLWVPLGRGRGHEARVLTALALYEPPAGAGRPGSAPAPPHPSSPSSSGVREIRVEIG